MSHDYLKTANAPLVDMIVATTGKIYKALIYSGAVVGQTNPQLYDVRRRNNMTPQRLAALLASSGYASMTFELDEKGVPKKGVKPKINNFVKQQIARLEI
jgi:hypothetical protein